MTTKNQTVSVYEALKKKIEEGFFSPAENLRETALAKEYGVSRNTVKKALLMLETDGYVAMEPNKGAHVRSYSKAEVLDFLEVRQALEGLVVKLVAQVINQRQINELQNMLDQMRKCRKAKDLLGCSALNREFHAAIYQSCPNRIAVDILIRLKNQMKKYNSKSILIPGRIDRSFEEHTAILAALSRHDAAKAQSLMEEHIRNVRETYEKYYNILF
jgi:DNA-binding GntR family transcriptional regulator